MPRRILGIDPGSRFCGYGLLETEKRKIVAAGCDVIKVDSRLPLNERLCHVYEEIRKVVEQFEPQVAAVESMFFGRNFQGIFSLGHARGVILLALAQQGVQIVEYTPREIKKAIAGNGNASKEQIRYMVGQLLPLPKERLTSDAADALAIALCHYNRQRF